MKQITLDFYSVNDFLPPEKTWVICELKDFTSGEVNLKGAYFEKGVFWESNYSDACGLNVSEKNHDETPICDWKVISWTKAKRGE